MRGWHAVRALLLASSARWVCDQGFHAGLETLMGSMSAENQARAQEHVARVRKLLEDAGYSEIKVETLDLGNRIAILWDVYKPWPDLKP